MIHTRQNAGENIGRSPELPAGFPLIDRNCSRLGQEILSPVQALSVVLPIILLDVSRARVPNRQEPTLDPTDFEPPLLAATAMNEFAKPWAVAGGWAIDLLRGKSSRQHDRVDVAVLREHQMNLRDHLPDWSFEYVINGKRRPWKDRQMLMLPIHELHASSPAGKTIAFLLNDSDGVDWMYRRDLRITLGLGRWIVRGTWRVPVIAPQIALLFKSKNPRPKDELDLKTALPMLTPAELHWLADAVARGNCRHPWLPTLAPLVAQTA